MKYLIITLFILAGCKTQQNVIDSRCVKTNINKTECIYCEISGRSIAISCNWIKES